MDPLQKPRPRPRRGQYVNQACHECKRRKVKCDGASPCGSCTTGSRSCFYYKNRHRKVHSNFNADVNQLAESAQLQQEMAYASPVESVNETTHSQKLDAASDHTSQPTNDDQDNFKNLTDLNIKSSEFCGPSSSEFTLNMVSGNLREMGMPTAILDRSNSESEYSSGPPYSLARSGPLMKLLIIDPLWDMKRDEALGLIQEWSNGIGSLYPVISHEKLVGTTNIIFESLEEAHSNNIQPRKIHLAELLLSNETNKLKIVLAIGRTLESGGRNDQGQRLFQSITEAIEGLFWDPVDINGIQLLVLVAIYHYHLDEEVRAGRIVGFAARLCLEMGLHCQSTTEKMFPNPEHRSTALRTFCSVFMLERRTCLGQGIPFSIQDTHVDSLNSLFASQGIVSVTPTIENHRQDDSKLVLSALLEWTKLAGRTWQALNSKGKEVELREDEIDSLAYQVLHWYDQLPMHLRLDANQGYSYDGQNEPKYIQAVLYSRKGQLLNLIYRPVLQSKARPDQNERHILSAVEVAKETLQMFLELNETTPFIRMHPIFFKHTLLTAFGNLLLIMVRGTDISREGIRVEFDNSLSLIKLLSTRSNPLMRLWQRLEGLQKLRAKFFDLSTNESSSGINCISSYKNPTCFQIEELSQVPSLMHVKGPASQSLYSSHNTQEFLNGGMGFLGELNASAEIGSFFEFPFV